MGNIFVAFATLAFGSTASSPAPELILHVVSPLGGTTIVAERPTEVEWTGASEGTRFDIDLHYCDPNSSCPGDECGDFIASLCPEGDAGCAAQDGGYEVVMPEPIVPGDGYRVRISQVGADNSRCSDSFSLMRVDEDSLGSEPSVKVLSPNANSVAAAGVEHKVEFDYHNGLGSSVGRFKMDLYASEGSGDCGTWQTSICDKPDRGCKASEGDYNVVIPASTASGTYSIRVGLFGDDSVYACSETFEVSSKTR